MQQGYRGGGGGGGQHWSWLPTILNNIVVPESVHMANVRLKYTCKVLLVYSKFRCKIDVYLHSLTLNLKVIRYIIKSAIISSHFRENCS